MGRDRSGRGSVPSSGTTGIFSLGVFSACITVSFSSSLGSEGLESRPTAPRMTATQAAAVKIGIQIGLFDFFFCRRASTSSISSASILPMASISSSFFTGHNPPFEDILSGADESGARSFLQSLLQHHSRQQHPSPYRRSSIDQ